MGNPGFSDRILSTLECSPRPPRAAVHSRTPVERTTNLIQYLHLQNFATVDARTWLKHESTAKRVQNSRHSTQPMQPLRRPPRRAPACTCPQRTQTGEPAPAHHPSEPSTRPTAAPRWPPRPLLRAARAPSVPSTPGAARPSPTRRAQLGHDGRRAPTAQTRRATSFGTFWSGLRHRGKAHDAG
jgi:hypothetical protein